MKDLFSIILISLFCVLMISGTIKAMTYAEKNVVGVSASVPENECNKCIKFCK